MLLESQKANYATNVQGYYEEIGWVVEQGAAAENNEEFDATEEREQETVEWHQVVCTSKL